MGKKDLLYLREVLEDYSTWVMIGILVILLIAVILRQRARKKKEFIYEVSAKDQRLAELDERVANPEYIMRAGSGAVKRYPYETSFFSAARAQREFEAFYIGLLVQTEMRREKFYTDISTPIEVGRDAACAITVPDDRLADKQFVLEMKDMKLEVRNLDTSHTVVLERGDAYHRVEKAAIVLMDGDVIRAGKSTVTVSFDG